MKLTDIGVVTAVVVIIITAIVLINRTTPNTTTTTNEQVTQTASPTTIGATTAATACIVTISGSKYDVTPLRSTHSGGDIFQCGTDMTVMYQQQHGSNLRMIQPYLIQ